MNRFKSYTITFLFVAICTVSQLPEQQFEKEEFCDSSTHIQYQILTINYNQNTIPTNRTDTVAPINYIVQQDPTSSVTITSIFGHKTTYTISPNLNIRLESWISTNDMITMNIDILLLKQIINTQVRTKTGEPVIISRIVKNRKIVICITPLLINDI